jgi:hypothetical protein
MATDGVKFVAGGGPWHRFSAGVKLHLPGRTMEYINPGALFPKLTSFRTGSE